MPHDSLVTNLRKLPGVESHQTLPLSAELLWTNGSTIDFPGWEGEEDQALIRQLTPLRIVEKEGAASNPLDVPPGQLPDELEHLILPTYGRGAVLIPSHPVEVDGINFPIVTIKGNGTIKHDTVVPGDVYGKLVNQDKMPSDKYTGGVTTLDNFTEDVSATRTWQEAGLRVRVPARAFGINRLFMTTGSEDVSSLEGKDYQKACLSTWLTRNPFSFQDALMILSPDDPGNVDMPKLKDNADWLLQVQAFFLEHDSDPRAQEIAQLLENGGGSGEDEWFDWLSSRHGIQMMRRTSHGLIHGEQHRQNSSLGVEDKDLADNEGLENHEAKKNYGSWETVKSESPDMASQIIKENLFVLSQVADLRVAFNIINNRHWDDGLTDIVNSYMDSMRSESPDIYPDVAYRMQKIVGRYPGYFLPTSRDSLYGISTLCFSDRYGNSSPMLPNTPVSPEILTWFLYTSIRSNIEPGTLPSEVKSVYNLEEFEVRFGCYYDEIPLIVDMYNQILNTSSFSQAFAKLTRDITEAAISINAESVPELGFEMAKNFLAIHKTEAFNSEVGDDKFVSVFLHFSGLKDHLVSLVACPQSRRLELLGSIDSIIPRSIDYEKIKQEVDDYYKD